MIEALTHLEGCKYFVATIVNEEERRFDMSQRMSQHQLALVIKGILSNFDETVLPLYKTLNNIGDGYLQEKS